MINKIKAVLSAGIAATVLSVATSATAGPEENFRFIEPGDVQLCLSSGPASDACRRVRFTFYIWPNLQKELAQIDLVQKLRPKGPRPEEVYWGGNWSRRIWRWDC